MILPVKVGQPSDRFLSPAPCQVHGPYRDAVVEGKMGESFSASERLKLKPVKPVLYVEPVVILACPLTFSLYCTAVESRVRLTFRGTKHASFKTDGTSIPRDACSYSQVESVTLPPLCFCLHAHWAVHAEWRARYTTGVFSSSLLAEKRRKRSVLLLAHERMRQRI